MWPLRGGGFLHPIRRRRSMPANPRPVRDERDGLLVFLAQQRLGLQAACYGLTEGQARLAPTASSLSLGGLVKQLAPAERSWMRALLAGADEPPADLEAMFADYVANFSLRPDETLAGVLADYEAAAAETERLVMAEEDLGRPVPVPKGVPWFPYDVDNWSVRWVLLHLIEETGRHGGHADILRESIDGANSNEVLAALEGWPETPWVKPWRPKQSVSA